VNGLALIKVPASYVQQSGKLIVEAPGFERYTQFITLQESQLPDEVRLAQVLPAPTDTPAPTETATPTPTIAETSTSTPTPTGTPTPTMMATPADTPTPTPTVTPVPDAMVAAAELNLRAGPGTAFAVLAALAKGDRLEVTGQSDSCAWLQVRTAAGGEGWVVHEIGNQEVTALNIPCDSVLEVVVPTPTPRPTLPPPTPIAPAALPAICAAATTSEQYTTAAWRASGDGQYKEAIQCAQACIRLFEDEALKQQAALTAPPPMGPPSDDATRQAIWNNWALNDVGTSYFIVGAAQQKLGDTAAARAAFQEHNGFPLPVPGTTVAFSGRRRKAPPTNWPNCSRQTWR